MKIASVAGSQAPKAVFNVHNIMMFIVDGKMAFCKSSPTTLEVENFDLLYPLHITNRSK